MANGIAITYGDVAPEAKENFTPTASEFKYNTLYKLQTYNMELYNYANPCEKYQTSLDGSAVAFPSSRKANIGLWSEQLSGDDGSFETAITLTLTSSGQYSSQGFTFTFDKFNGIYATDITITWYRVTTSGSTLLSTKTYTPNSAFYFCQNKVENFNKVTIVFKSINAAKNYLKLYALDFGYGTVFYGKELRNAKISQQIDPISSEIVINTCDFTVDSKSDIEYSFQTKQPLTVYFNDKLISTVFVKQSKRTGKFIWNVSAEDYIGLLDKVMFVGGMYSKVSAKSILESIFAAAKIPYSVATEFSSVLLSGHIPYTTCREALKQVAFACMAVVDTSNSNVVKVKSLDTEIKQTIPRSRIKQGQSFSDDDTVTRVELTYHTYKAIDEVVDVYKAEDDGTGTDIFVKFSEPLHNLSIKNGTITEQGTNYAIITANENCVLSGKKYEHTEQVKKKTNPKVLASELENVKTITSATLISASNVDNVLQKCYNWLIKTNTINMSIVEGKNVKYGDYPRYGRVVFGSAKYGVKASDVVTYDKTVNVGDNLNFETEYLGDGNGTLIKQSFGLNGNILVKDVILK